MKNQLVQFFGGYFHEDWDLEAATPVGVVAASVNANPKMKAEVAAAIRSLLAELRTDSELGHALFHDFGCYYDPEADGLTARAWLTAVTLQLEEG